MTDTLFGDVPPPSGKKRKGKTQPADAPAPVKQAIDAFHAGFLRRFGFKPNPREYGRFGKELQGLVEAWGADDVLALVGEFFTTTDPYVLRSDYKPADFVRLAQRLQLRRHGHAPPSAVAAENIDAAARASSPRPARRELK